MIGPDAIGGYFGFHAPSASQPKPYPAEFSTFRGALLGLLDNVLAKDGQNTIWFPAFVCPAVKEVFRLLGDRVKLKEYNIGPDLTPFNLFAERGDLVYRYNVFGLDGAETRSGDIVDNAHALFAEPLPDRHTIYSLRKFLAVPDGARLVSPVQVSVGPPLVLNESALYLLLRLDQGPERGFSAFQEWERKIFSGSVQGISHFSTVLLGTFDYDLIKRRRRENFQRLHDNFRGFNTLGPQVDVALCRPDFVPFCYPLLLKNGKFVRESLLKFRVYTPTLWSGIVDQAEVSDFERDLVVNTVHLPIDQRYSISDMDSIVEILHQIRGRSLCQ